MRYTDVLYRCASRQRYQDCARLRPRPRSRSAWQGEATPRALPAIPKIQMIYFYASVSIFIAIFLNPQQTKYFGGLSTALKHNGFFVSYREAENFIYWVSWFFILFFFTISSC
jgi:preprotein translocase subunit SecG